MCQATPNEIQICQKIIPEISEERFKSLSDHDQSEYLRLYREQVSPRFEEWRNPHRIKSAYGGRGAGTKSRSSGSLILQFAENPGYFGDRIQVLCVRDVQKSIEESSWKLLKNQLERLKYLGWKVTNNKITNLKNGSYFVFNGLNDMTSSDLKSYESFDILFIEEGAPISKEALLSIEATFRKKGSEIWILFNRDKNRDPCYELYCVNPDPSWSIIACRPGRLDNPWWDETNLQEQWDRLKEIDHDEWEHQFLGYPRSQGEKAVHSRTDVEAMFSREIEAKGEEAIGCDVARFGKDASVAYRKIGLVVVERKACHGFDTQDVAGMLWTIARKDSSIPIKVDSGYNPGVIDVLRGWGANVIEVAFGSTANDEDAYTNAASEMMFTLPVKELSIPEEYRSNNLIEDLTERYFNYDNAGRKKLEPKDGTSVVEGGRSKQNFKGRHGGRSPDDGDALCLAFYKIDVGGCY